jgi:hypothetical protein
MNWIDRFFRWLDQNAPLRAWCGHWKPKKDLEWMTHRIQGNVRVCKECKQRIESV